MELITSAQNPLVKLIHSLNYKKYRVETGLFLAEGKAVLTEARVHGWRPHAVIFRHGQEPGELGAWASAQGVRCLAATDGIMEVVSAQANPPDVVALIAQRWLGELPDLRPHDLWLALEDIRDPGNLGAIIRTADAVAVGGVILVGRPCDPYARECVRATMGSIFHVPLARMEQEAFLRLARAWPGEAVGAQVHGTQDFRRAYREPVLLVMGSEGVGLSDALAQACSALARIPMAGPTQSLNLATATALMLYEIRRDRLA